MSEFYTETNKISYGKNIMNSFFGVIIGLIIFILSFVVLWKNEGHNVEQIAKANYINKTAVEISAERIDRANDNKLVQLSGNATTGSTLTDGIITLPNVFALSRNVEMYQWKEIVKTETKDELGGSTTETKTYTYEKVWSERKIDSSEFKKKNYVNPPFSVKSSDFYAKSGKLGEFELTEKQSKAMNDYIEYEDLPQQAGYKVYNNTYYKGDNPESPNVGDIRISYEYVPSNTDLSIIAQQKSDNTLTNYSFKNSTIYLQQSGIKTKAEMIETFKKNNQLLTNLIRIGGWLLMFIGLNLMLSPLIVIFKVVPIFKSIVGFLSAGMVFIISLILSLLTISIAWFAYRPFLTVLVIAAAILVVYMLRGKGVKEVVVKE